MSHARAILFALIGACGVLAVGIASYFALIAVVTWVVHWGGQPTPAPISAPAPYRDANHDRCKR